MSTQDENAGFERAVQAAAWAEKLKESEPDSISNELDAWCSQSVQNREELLLAIVTDLQLSSMSGGRFSYPLPGYRSGLHRWLITHLLDAASLQRLALQAQIDLKQMNAADLAQDPSRALYLHALQHTHDAGDEPPANTSLANRMAAAIEALPGDLRSVLLLCSRDRRTYEDAAAELGLEPRAVQERLTKARHLIATKVFGA
jgi:hypothetical protein